MTRHRMLFWGVVAVAVAFALFLALRKPPLVLELADVKVAPFEHGFEEEGRTRLRHRYLLAAPVAGNLRRIALEPGDAVAAGTVAVTLDPAAGLLLDAGSLAQTRAQRDAAIDAARAARERATAAESADGLAQAMLARIEALHAKGMASAVELDRARSEARSARASRAAAKADFGVAEQNRAALDGVLARQGRGDGTPVTLAAPIDGVVIRRYQESAVPVAAGAPLVEFGQPEDLEIVVEVLSQDAIQLVTGGFARVLRWGGPAPLEARVARVEPGGFTKFSALGVEEQRTLVRLDIVTPREHWLKLGDAYRVEVQFLLDQRERVLQVPSSALFKDGDGWAVYRVVDGSARRTAVVIGARAAAATEIRSGLQEREQVIAHPDDRIDDGVRVRSAQ